MGAELRSWVQVARAVTPEMTAAVAAADTATSSEQAELIRDGHGGWRVALSGVPVGTLCPAYSGMGRRVGWTAWTPATLPVEHGRIYSSRLVAVAALVVALCCLGGEW